METQLTVLRAKLYDLKVNEVPGRACRVFAALKLIAPAAVLFDGHVISRAVTKVCEIHRRALQLIPNAGKVGQRKVRHGR